MKQQNFHFSAIERRRFLKGSLAFVGSLFLNPLQTFAESGSSSRVVIVQNRAVRKKGWHIDSKIAGQMLNVALENLFPGKTAAEVWRTLFSAQDLVAVKLNCLAGKGLSPHPELVRQIVAGIQTAGVPANRIILFDRLDEDLKRAGFRLQKNRGNVLCAGNDSFGYSPDLLVFRSIGSLVSRVLTDYATAIVNVPVLKDHGIVGFSGGLKNFFGVIHNPNKYHLNVGDPYVPDLCAHPLIKNKLRLTIFDAINAQYDGGPPYIPQFVWPFNGILVATDPVAADFVGWQIIEEKRHEMGLPSLKQVHREPRYIFTAADSEHRLGLADPSRIEVVRKKMGS